MPSIPKNQLRFSSSIWPRDLLDEARVAMFQALLQEGETFPPIEVVPQPDGSFLICDGVHRSHAAIRAGRVDIEAEILSLEGDESPFDLAYRRALETATRSALPLNRAERQRAALRLIETRPDLSRRAIARLVGVAHSTVDRWAEGLADSSNTTERDPTRTTEIETSVQISRRLAGLLARLDESRGLLDYLSPSRMGRHLSQAFEDRLGDEALGQAARFAEWTAAAVRELQANNS